MIEMNCKLFFYYNKNNEWETILNNIKKHSSSYRIITTNRSLGQYLNENGKKSYILDDLIPSRGPKANEIYQITKKISESYKKAFEKIKINDIEIFKGFDYSFFRQLELLVKIKKVLEDEVENTILVFENFRDSYFSMIKIAKQIGYETEFGINFVNADKIEFINSGIEKQKKLNKNKFQHVKSINFLKNSFYEKNSTEIIKNFLNIGRKIVSLKLNSLSQKIISKKNNNTDNLMMKIISKISSKTKPKCIFFITGTREDLFFKSLEEILKKFKINNIYYQIITTDLATSMILEKRKINHISLFEEFNIILKNFNNSKEGKNILQDINNIIHENEKLIGINEFSEYLIDQIKRTCVLTNICSKIFKNNELISICPIADGEILENISIEFAKKNNLKNITMLPGIFDMFPYFLEWFHSEKICVGGVKDENAMVRLGYDKNRIVVTGNPRYDFFKSLNTFNAKEYLKKKYNIKSNKKLILIARSIWQQDDEEWISNLIKFSNKNNFEVIIKIHPIYKTKSHSLSEEKIKLIQKKCEGNNFLITYDEDLYKLISASDIVLIHESSTVGVDVSLADKPFLVINFYDSDMGFETHFSEIGAALYVDNYIKLEQRILDILNDEKYLNELKLGRDKVCEMYNYKNDGNAADRIFNILINQD
jgi:hypothetical protein